MVETKSEIYEMITDIDGSCRDINFEGVNSSGLRAYIDKITQSYSTVICQVWERNQESTKIPVAELHTHLMKHGLSVHIHAEDSEKLLQQLELFIDIEDDNQPFLEVTFFPQDVNVASADIESFLHLLEEWLITLQATKFYVRYENASWDFGDISRYSGVIFTSDSSCT